jgi:hypothetical protein
MAGVLFTRLTMQIPETGVIVTEDGAEILRWFAPNGGYAITA